MLLRPPATGCGNDTPRQAQAEAKGARKQFHCLMDPQGMTGAIRDRACPSQFRIDQRSIQDWLQVDPGSTAD